MGLGIIQRGRNNGYSLVGYNDSSIYNLILLEGIIMLEYIILFLAISVFHDALKSSLGHVRKEENSEQPSSWHRP